MFEDLIPEKENIKQNGCYNCQHITSSWSGQGAALYCNFYKKPKTALEGKHCKNFEEKNV